MQSSNNNTKRTCTGTDTETAAEESGYDLYVANTHHTNLSALSGHSTETYDTARSSADAETHATSSGYSTSTSIHTEEASLPLGSFPAYTGSSAGSGSATTSRRDNRGGNTSSRSLSPSPSAGACRW